MLKNVSTPLIDARPISNVMRADCQSSLDNRSSCSSCVAATDASADPIGSCTMALMSTHSREITEGERLIRR